MTFDPVPKPLLNGKRASQLALKPIKPREWLVENFIPMEHVTLLYGDGGEGKSLLALQLLFSVVTGKKWMNLDVRHGPAYYLSCEDDEDEIQLRLLDFNCDFDDLDNLVYLDQVGETASLVEQSQKAKLQPTSLFRNIESNLDKLKPALVVIDNLANVFPEDDYQRSFPQQFMTMLRKLAKRNKCAFLLLAHPSLSGMNSGRGTSGTTTWSNSARSRLYLKSVDGDKTAKTLTVMKANHAARTEINLRFVNNKFERETEVSSSWKTERAEGKFLELLRTFTQQGQRVNPNSGANYAPKKFADHPSNEGTTKKMFQTAMQSLLAKRKIRIEKGGSPSRPTSWLEIT